MGYVLESAESEDGSHRPVGVRQVLHVGHQIDARTGPHVHAAIVAARKQRTQIGNLILAFDLIRTYLK